MGNGLLTAAIINHKETFKKLVFYKEIKLRRKSNINAKGRKEKHVNQKLK